MRTIAVEKHMRKDNRKHYKAVVALFANKTVRAIKCFVVKHAVSLIIAVIGLVLPGTSFIDFSLTYKWLTGFTAEETKCSGKT